uniref:protein-serine/threonine phosphatase n=2 Tax=Brassica oleracea var. oleracea TaxID=109376 RepID=A0A0D3CPQ7_BRAOL
MNEGECNGCKFVGIPSGSETAVQSVGIPSEYTDGILTEFQNCRYCVGISSVQVKEILIEESNVQPVNTPVTVCGDIHGQFHDLMKLFQTGGHVPATNYILWEISLIEVTTVVKFSPFFCFLKLAHITLLRGNHESRQLTQVCVILLYLYLLTAMLFTQFLVDKYGFLLLESIAAKDPLSVSVAILHQFNILPEMYQVGYTKLFFRTGQIGVLEDTRNRTLHGILRLQSCFRGHQARSRLREHKRRVTVLQSFVRGEKVRKEYTELLRRHRASAAIQSHVKRRIAKRQYKATVDASVVIQSAIRGELVRRCAGDIGWLKSGGTKVLDYFLASHLL